MDGALPVLAGRLPDLLQPELRDGRRLAGGEPPLSRPDLPARRL